MRYSAPRILRLNMYRKPHHKFLQNFPVVDVSQVVMCVSSQINERVIGEGSFAKGFTMSSNLSRLFLSHKKSRDIEVVHAVMQRIVVQSSQRAYLQNYKG